jgi:hypothetical protein
VDVAAATVATNKEVQQRSEIPEAVQTKTVLLKLKWERDFRRMIHGTATGQTLQALN